jgi:hypothetical protein
MKKFMLVPIVVALTACSGMTTLKTENTTEKRVPTWYLDHEDVGTQAKAWYKPWDTEGMYYAVAEDVSPSMEMAVKKATLKAKAKIADRVAGEMNNNTNITYKESGNPSNPIGSGGASDVIVNKITDTVLRTYGVDRKLVVYNPEQNNYRAFIMLKISKADVQSLAERYDAKHTSVQ